MVRGSLDERIRERLRELLLAAASDPDAHAALAQYFQTSGFAPIDAESTRACANSAARRAAGQDQVE